MTADGFLLVGMTLVGAAWLVLHVLVVWQAMRSSELAWRHRLVALVPPVAPAVAWAGGRRVAPVVWGILLVLYVVLRLV